jgi:mannose/fructose/N-acetylgalactosamine-specific phosphotransferase system component IIB
MRCQEEVRFYQQQAAEAMQTRDRATSEAATARSMHAELKKRFSDQDAQLRQEKVSVKSLKLQIASFSAEIESLKKQASVAEQVPVLRSDVARMKLDLFAMTSDRETLQVCNMHRSDRRVALKTALSAEPLRLTTSSTLVNEP